MRNPPNETLGDTFSPAAKAKGRSKEHSRADAASRARRSTGECDGHEPIRKCILSGERETRHALIRLALGPAGEVLPDVRARAPGRGAWIGVRKAELEQALDKGKLRGALARAFKSNSFTLDADLPELIARALQQAALNRLGLEARAGYMVTGSERLETAARAGKLHMLFHAGDAAADGTRKLDAAWRVGSDREGSAMRGLVLPLGRAILSVALGRENVVHGGLTDPNAAGRTRDAFDRWLHFIGPDPEPAPCETASHGASALGAHEPGSAERTHEDFE